MKAWYPNDLARRPLQVSFSVVRYDDGNFTRVHETELVHHLEDLDSSVEPRILRDENAVVLEVSLSMIFQGRELLGTDGAIEVVAGVPGPDTRSDDGGPVQVPYGRTLAYEFHAQGDSYRYRYMTGGRTVHDLVLPAAETNLEWGLMNRRLDRIKMELGDTDERLAAEADLKRYGPDGLVAYTFTAPLDELFTQPRPEGVDNRL